LVVTPNPTWAACEPSLDRDELAKRSLPYEKLDQLVFDQLLGVR